MFEISVFVFFVANRYSVICLQFVFLLLNMSTQLKLFCLAIFIGINNMKSRYTQQSEAQSVEK